jgi:hypothetical protein
VAPPRIVEVEVPADVPEACRRLCAVTLPAGSTALDVMEKQAACIRQYEEQVAACARGLK